MQVFQKEEDVKLAFVCIFVCLV